MKISRTLCSTALIISLAAFAFAKDQEFRLEKPDAQNVELMCECNGWKSQPMTKQSDGTWAISIPLSPGTYGYKFLVNGTDWVFDPKNQNRKSVDGVENSAIEVTADASTPAPAIARSMPVPSNITAASESRPTADAPPISTISATPGQVTNFEVPLTKKEQTDAMSEGNPTVATAKIELGVPNGFDPQRTYPLLLISATVNMPNSSLFPQYQRDAMDAGWVVMAADGPQTPKEDNHAWRWAMISAGLRAIESNWPVAKTWPVACGGFSGGAKRSGFMAGRFAAKTQHQVIGMLMGGCNQDTASESLRDDHPPFGAFVNIPIFLSSGTKDKIATPESHQAVRNSMKASGFNKVRLESYDGAHDVYSPHTTEALSWFMAEFTKRAPAKRESDFDKFFKKKSSP